MSDLAALVVDAENLEGMFRRVYGRHSRADINKIRRYLSEEVLPSRSLLWTRWYVSRQVDQTEESRSRSHRFYGWLERNGVRVIECEAKPINQANGQHELDTADFHIVEGIDLACAKATTVIVASGDGHLASAISKAHERHGCRVEILCDRHGLSSRLTADQVHVLDDIAPQYDLLSDYRVRAASRPAVAQC